jgi:outer membrane lipoprotein
MPCPARLRVRKLCAALLAGALLAGCAAHPPAAPPSAPPAAVVAALDAYLDQQVTWGGMVIETANFERYSEIEVLAFPLDRRGRPQPDALDLGRFVVLRAGFLDPQIFAPGRFVTATGRITGDRRGHLRQAAYVWPELDVHELELWPPDFRQPTSRFHISVGVGIRR